MRMTVEAGNGGALLAALIAGLATAPQAGAQSAQEFIAALSGSWYAFDPAYSSGDGPCRIDLAPEPGADGQYTAMPEGCADIFAAAESWSIDNANLMLADAQGRTLAQLGGNQARITGLASQSGRGVILERAEGDAHAQFLSNALRRHTCFYLGTSAECSDTQDRDRPVFDDDGTAQVELSVNLTAYSQPRRGSASLGVISQGNCVIVDQCLAASDGLWCRARFGETEAWLGKAAVRQAEWPIVTYVNGCTAPPGAAAPDTSPPESG
ncbi:AprI/Inh family metalloprotease inhibitor [Profundibacterium mesophilum]|uniref:Protease inhibitor Inh domain containing protein n=1 Tax=Profundibacterium mesophilum KAUST100406-0324 TaxID=1037889 RepID=A0A921NRA8_9RHOB|nr:AprI/Inh family metalloprotease inhibitor [Profundibacterium mesophilum]KAF0676067.1 Protease inhibitor Inh domain containing protein [Profundibacterium mesophilum KAUST100406-0324]